MADYKDRLKDYVQVNERIVAFYADYPKGSLQSEMIYRDDKLVVMKAWAYRSPKDPKPGIGHSAMQIPGPTTYTRGSETENAETSAWGRALASLGFEVKRGVASRDEIDFKQDNGAQVVGDEPVWPEDDGWDPDKEADGAPSKDLDKASRIVNQGAENVRKQSNSKDGISEGKQKRFWYMCNGNKEIYRQVLDQFGFKESNEIPWRGDTYDRICAAAEEAAKGAPQTPRPAPAAPKAEVSASSGSPEQGLPMLLEGDAVTPLHVDALLREVEATHTSWEIIRASFVDKEPYALTAPEFNKIANMLVKRKGRGL